VFPDEFAVGFTVMLHGGSTCATLKVFSVQVHSVVVCGLVAAVVRRREGVVAAARWCGSLLHGGVAVCFTEVWQFASFCSGGCANGGGETGAAMAAA